MYPFIFSAILTGLILLLDVRSKAIQHAYKYIAMFFLFAGLGFLFSSQVNAEIIPRTYLARDPFSNQIILKVENKTSNKKTTREINKELLEEYKQRMHYHYDEGVYCLKQAEDSCLLFPSQNDREKAFLCFTTFFATLAPKTPKDKAIATLIAICLEYGSLVMFEWQYIDTKLQQSKYHFEMEEHYRLTVNYLINQLHAEKK